MVFSDIEPVTETQPLIFSSVIDDFFYHWWFLQTVMISSVIVDFFRHWACNRNQKQASVSIFTFSFSLSLSVLLFAVSLFIFLAIFASGFFFFVFCCRFIVLEVVECLLRIHYLFVGAKIVQSTFCSGKVFWFLGKNVFSAIYHYQWEAALWSSLCLSLMKHLGQLVLQNFVTYRFSIFVLKSIMYLHVIYLRSVSFHEYFTAW